MAKKIVKGKGKGKTKKPQLLPQLKKDASVFLSSEEGKVTKENVVKTAMTLGIMDKLTSGRLTGGHTVAATGTIDPLGNVGPVGGVPQKTVAVEQGGASVFFVPKAEYHDALSKATPSLHIYPVTSLDQALKVLEHLGGHLTVPKSAGAPAAA